MQKATSSLNSYKSCLTVPQDAMSAKDRSLDKTCPALTLFPARGGALVLLCDRVWPHIHHLIRSSACPVAGRSPGNLRQQRFWCERKPTDPERVESRLAPFLLLN